MDALLIIVGGTGVGECLEVGKRVKIGRVDISSAWGGGLLFYQPTDTSGGIREELRNFGKGCKWVEVGEKICCCVKGRAMSTTAASEDDSSSFSLIRR